MKNDKETFVAVIYTDGTKFINTKRHGRISTVCSIPQAKLDPSNEETLEMEATLALFQSTGIRVKPSEPYHVCNFEHENFNIEVFCVKVGELPPLYSLKSVRRIQLTGKYEGESVPAISEFRYTDLKDIGDFRFSLEGVKEALISVSEVYSVEEEKEEVE